MQYFPHDTDAMSDDKMMVLRSEAGLEAVAVYWAVIERMHAEEEPLNLTETDVGTKSLSILLGLGYETLASYVSRMCDIGLLERVDGTDMVTSGRVERYIEQMDAKRETARQNGKKGGRKPKSNRRGNRRGTNVGTKADATSGDILNIKHINKKSGADGAEKPPSATALCPLCASPLKTTGISEDDYWWCEACRDYFPKGKASWA